MINSSKTILFLNTATYLSIPQYKALLPYLTDYYCVLLNTNDTPTLHYNKHFYEGENSFDHYTDLAFKFTYTNQYLKIRQGRMYINILNDYLNKLKPDIIISTSDMAFSDRVVTKWCKKHNTPFIILQPSFIVDPYIKPRGIKWKLKYFLINKLFKTPRYTKQQIYGNDYPQAHLLLWSPEFVIDEKRSNTHFIGNPALDPIFDGYTPNRQFKNTILVCPAAHFRDSIFTDEINRQIFAIYHIIFQAFPQVHFIFKIHPRDKIKPYKKLFGRYKNIQSYKHKLISELLQQVDLHVSVESNTSFEALAAGVRTILINPNNQLKSCNHFNGIAPSIIKPEWAVPTIQAFLEDVKEQREKYFGLVRESYFQRMTLGTEGKAGFQAAKIIHHICENNAC